MDDDVRDILKSAERGKHRAGQRKLIKHLKGQRLTRQQAIKAKCYNCNGMGELKICNIKTCALYPYSPCKI